METTLIIATIGVFIALITLLIGLRQFYYKRNVEEAKFWLELRNSFKQHDYVHINLRNTENWEIKEDDWAKIDAYLGQLELIYVFLERKLINVEILKSQYAYRIANIIENDEIVNKIISEKEDWKYLIKLFKYLCPEEIKKLN